MPDLSLSCHCKRGKQAGCLMPPHTPGPCEPKEMAENSRRRESRATGGDWEDTPGRAESVCALGSAREDTLQAGYSLRYR